MVHLIKSHCTDYLKVLETPRLDEHCSPLSDCPDAMIVVRPAIILAGRASTDTGTGKSRTPPIPSSSPGPANDHMDISPLPHKPPFIQRNSGLTPIASRGPTKTEKDPSGLSGYPVLPTCLPVWVVLWNTLKYKSLTVILGEGSRRFRGLL